MKRPETTTFEVDVQVMIDDRTPSPSIAEIKVSLEEGLAERGYEAPRVVVVRR